LFEVGWYELVWHTGTSLATWTAYCHFFIEIDSSLALFGIIFQIWH